MAATTPGRNPADGAEQEDMGYRAAQDRLETAHHSTADPAGSGDPAAKVVDADALDRDYLDWKDRSTRRMDSDYRRWRQQTGQNFSDGFVEWLAAQPDGKSDR